MIAALRYYLKEDADLNTADVDWQEFCRLCKAHSVEGIVYAVLRKARIEMPIEVKERLGKGYLAAVYASHIQSQAFAEISQALEEKKIPFIPFKGAVIRSVYPNPELRTMGDIDILVRREDMGACHDILTDRGFHLAENVNEWLYVKAAVRIELHERFFYLEGFKSILDLSVFDDIWERTAFDGEAACREIDIHDHYALLLLHMAKHSAAGFGMRMVLDIAAWQHRYKNGIDPSRLEYLLSRCKIFAFSKRIFALCESWFGVDPPIRGCDFTKEADNKVGDLIVENGAFGRDNPNFFYHDRNLVKEYLFHPKNSAIRIKFGYLLFILFPSPVYLSKKYTYLRKRPYLLPFAWMQRCVYSIGRSPVKTCRTLFRVIGGGPAKDLKGKMDQFGL